MPLRGGELSTALGGAMAEKKKCPICGALAVVPIVYGLPPKSLAERARRGEILLGGCVVRGNDPQWGCRACGAKFHSPDQGQTLIPAKPSPWD